MQYLQKWKYTYTSSPVHGGWSLWSGWGTCSATYDVGIQRRDRTCSNPYPDRFGDHCFGDARDDRICTEQSCAGELFTPLNNITILCENGSGNLIKEHNVYW